MEALLTSPIVQWTLLIGGLLGTIVLLLWLAQRLGPSPRRENAVYTLDNNDAFGR